MQNDAVIKKLIDIKRQISEMGVEYLETLSPVPLSDFGRTLKPFINIDSSVDQAIKKLSSESVPGSIPKSNSLRS